MQDLLLTVHESEVAVHADSLLHEVLVHRVFREPEVVAFVTKNWHEGKSKVKLRVIESIAQQLIMGFAVRLEQYSRRRPVCKQQRGLTNIKLTQPSNKE